MAKVHLRHFKVAPPPPDALVTPADVTLVNEHPFELNLARVLDANARAVPYRGPLLPRLIRREMNLVMSLFEDSLPGRPLVRHNAYDGSSLHIRRFVIEAVALGALTAVVGDKRSEYDEIAHFDALKPGLKDLYPKTGIRPDLRFAGGGLVLAGEARGRGRRRPSKPAAAEPLNRLQALLKWSRQEGCDPVCMAWSWLSAACIEVDFFEFGEDPFAPTAESDHLVPLEVADEAELWTQEQTSRSRERSAKQRVIQQATEDWEKHLFEDARSRKLVVPGMRQRCYGEWQSIPTFRGGPGPQVLLAAAIDHMGYLDTADPDIMYRGMTSDLEVYSNGRVLVAIDWRARDLDEAGSMIDQMMRS